MKDIQKMKRERQELITEMRSITSAAEARADKRLTDAEGQRWSELNVLVDNMAEDIKRAEKMNALEASESNGVEGSSSNGSANSSESRFETFGDFLQAVRSASMPGSRIDERLTTRGATGQGEFNPADGGFLVQTDHLTEIMSRAYDTSVLASRARRIPIGPTANRLSWNEINETSRVAGSRWGGIRGYWGSEAATVTASKTSFVRKSLDLEKLMAFVYVTEELLQDTVGLQSLTTGLVGDEFAYLMDNAIVRGTGAGQPLGVLNSPAIVSVAKESGQVASTIVYENIVKMHARLYSRSRQNAVWYINQDCEPQLHTMAMVVGVGGVPVYLPASGVSGSPFATLYGKPVIPIEQCSTVGTVGDIILMDPTQYMIIDKGGVRNDVSIHVRFLYDEQVFRFVYRVNGMPMWNSALTPANGTNTVSPYISLATRA